MTSDTDWDIPDPLYLDVVGQLRLLLDAVPAQSRYRTALEISLSEHPLLPTLSQYMLFPSLTLTIAKLFRPLLVDLCARWLDSNEDPLDKLEALALLIEVHEELYPVLSSFLGGALQKGGPLREFFKLDDRLINDLNATLLHRILLAYYRILRATPSVPDRLNWDLSLLLKLCTTPQLDRGARWLTIRCYALQSNMSERKRLSMEEKLLGELGLEDCTVAYGENVDGSQKHVDGWLLPVLEERRTQDFRIQIASAPQPFFTRSLPSLHTSDLSSRVVNIHGILLLRSSEHPPGPSRLVLTSSALITIRKIAVNLSLRRPTLLSSAPSSGKTTILEYLASRLFSSQSTNFVTIHLADTSLDPRALLGSYVSSTSHAGSFEWRDGVLVKAMREGKWVLLKDIDRANDDVLSLLLPLVESLTDNKPIGARAKLSVPSRGVVEASESFSIFAARSLDMKADGDVSSPRFLGAYKWSEIVISQSSMDDLRLIVNSKYPRLAGGLADALIDVWKTVKGLRTLSSTRTVGIRDLEKLCGRVSQLVGDNHLGLPSSSDRAQSIADFLPNSNIREDLYLEARDVFFAVGTTSQSSLSQRTAIARAVSEKLSLSEETCEWLLKRRTPTFEIEKDIDGRPVSVRCGRTLLPVRRIDNLPGLNQPRSFNMHKHAARLMSQLASCIMASEPVLLSGETGTGKTSVISHLASLLNMPLTSLNLSTQTESSDLIGGFKPVSAHVPAQGLHQRFLELFQKTFSSKKNEAFHRSLRKAINDAKWKVVVKLWYDATKLAMEKLGDHGDDAQPTSQDMAISEPDATSPRKRRRLRHGKTQTSEVAWLTFKEDVRQFEVQHVLDKGKFAFHFVEGPIVEAIRKGAWILLDEINLASPETLECISELLQGPDASITLTEKGSLEPVPRHPEFRVFACMNPATDVGKKDLPSNIRAKFTEIDVPPPDEDEEVLLDIISHYIGHLAVADKSCISDISQFYTSMKRMSVAGKLSDGSGHRPHYSMRTLARALTFASDSVLHFPLRRALYEGFLMAFAMVLDRASMEAMLEIANRTVLRDIKNIQHFITQTPSQPGRVIQGVVQFGPFWLTGGENEKEDVADYILTPSVQRKLIDLSRIITTKRYPILIEGPTSSGKTSAIQYLARRTGHNFVRINNHEHTDIQEYIGTYVSEPGSGGLIFKDGLLVRALRRGDWIVLDELNLAPTDVLEALNRLLDDNRELLVPETQEIVKPHPNFMLFATQNPSGVYAGRKTLSRALRNRFLEVHFSDVPPTELQEILCQRSRIAPSHSRSIVDVFLELQRRRQTARIFEGKEGFATLRDLFRWADRDAHSLEELGINGYMLLAERTRHDEDKDVVKSVLEDIMKIKIDADRLYESRYIPADLPGEMTWTKSLKRLFVLLDKALSNNEPVLLVGETGTGKTSICQVYSLYQGKRMRAVNCHQNTEASDIIGGLRPIRQGDLFETHDVREALALLEVDVNSARDDPVGFLSNLSARLASNISQREREIIDNSQRLLRERSGLLKWRDGPLVLCMRHGDIFLLDEISLADDSVLERLNSVLEPSRTLTLAEKGGENLDDSLIEADASFKFVATMNPGGDFGKKELSPALRNRFTEIWVPSIMKRDELSEIINNSWAHIDLQSLTRPLLDFVEWFLSQVKDASVLTLRNIQTWIEFCNVLHLNSVLTMSCLFIQGGHISIVDGIPSLPQLSSWSASSLRSLQAESDRRLKDLSPLGPGDCGSLTVKISGDQLYIGLLSMKRGNEAGSSLDAFNFEAATSLNNTYRLVRACQIARPILLEGHPGVGKTSLVTALAAASGQRLCRINLSEQTDLVDLFGSDLPVDGDASKAFAWADAEFLKALKDGHWVLLDEMNLASQSVLEGLNAVFDHRGTVYIPELDRSFIRHPNFRVFAAQNPLNQGSGRKGLPKSFLSRFTKVFMEQLSADDLVFICHRLYPKIPLEVLRTMIAFNTRLHEEVVLKRNFGLIGAPWEFNLRDLMRWASVMQQHDPCNEPWRFLNAIYRERFRTDTDKQCVLELFREIFKDNLIGDKLAVRCIVSPAHVSCGSASLERGGISFQHAGACLLPSQANHLEAALSAIKNNWLLIVNGSEGAGKTTFVQSLAFLSGQQLEVLTLGSTSDASDLVGSFEQVSMDRRNHDFRHRLLGLINDCIAHVDDYDFSTQERLLALKENILRGALNGEELRDVGESLSTFAELDGALKSLVRNAVDDYCRSETSELQFAWVDGPLVRAMKSGKWILLDSANLCSPSVLDRLNPLCEINGSLVLTEKGSAQDTIYPHPGFRLVMTVNTGRGEMSRAMRNRGIEVYLEAAELHRESRNLISSRRVPPVLFEVDAVLRDLTSRFELARRALFCFEADSFRDAVSSRSPAPPYNDALSAELASHCALVDASEPEQRRALLLALFGSSDVLYDRYLLRMLKLSSAGSNPSIHDNFLSVSRNEFLSKNARVSAEKSSIGKREIRQPYYEWPYIDWISQGDSELYLHRSAFLELRILAAFLSRVIADREQRSMLTSSLQEKPDTNTEYTLEFLKAVSAFAMEFTILKAAEDAPSCVQSLLKLVHYADYLYADLAHSLLDQSISYLFSLWITDCIEEAPEFVRRKLKSHTLQMFEHYTLVTGQRLLEIWHAMLREPLPAGTAVFLLGLESYLTNNELSYSLKKRIFDLLALKGLGVPALHPDESDEVRHLVAEATSMQPVDDCRTDLRAREHVGLATRMTSLLIELPGLLHIRSNKALLSKVIDIQIRSVCSTSHIERVCAYRRLLWQTDTEGGAPCAAVAEAFIEWHKAVWAGDDSTQVTQASEPSECFTPVFLRSVISLRNALSTCKMGDIYAIDELLADELRRSLIECSETIDRHDMIASALLHNVAIVLRAVSGGTEEANRVNILIGAAAASNSCILLRPFLLAVKDLQTKTLSLDALRGVISLLEKLERCQHDGERVQVLGLSWIALARSLFDIYVPNLSLDPALIHAKKVAYGASQVKWIQSQISVQTTFESLRTGRGTNFHIRLLSEQMDELVAQSRERRPSKGIVRESNAHSVRSFWEEIRVFASDIISSDRIERLVISSNGGSEAFRARAKLLEGTVSNFMRRLKTVYAAFQDLLPAIELGLLQFQFGLSLISYATSTSGPKTLQDVFSFPPSRARYALVSAEPQSFTQGHLSMAYGHLVKLLSIARSASNKGWTRELIAALRNCYDNLVAIWRARLAEEEEHKRQSETLYRTTTSMESGESEDKEIQELFPLFAEADDSDTSSFKTNQESAERDALTGCELADEIMSIHLDAFTSYGNAAASGKLPWDEVQLKIASLLSDAQIASLSYAVDSATTALRLQFLRRSRDCIRQPESGTYNFYRDPNYKESKNAFEILRTLKKNLYSLISTWPDQLVLQHLRDRCDSILSMSINSPLAKLLGAVERLLIHTEDWEMYANRDNSLASNRHTLIRLIVDWRKLELFSWSRILESELNAFLKELAQWWFRLYEALITGVLSAAHEQCFAADDPVGHYLDSLRPLVEDFMRSSPLGQFEKRLRLLDSFALFTSICATVTASPGKEALLRTSNVLSSLHQIYSIHSPKVEAYFLERRSVIEKDIQDLIRLATWKDVNVYALQQSAQRTHKQLYRRIRKFRELLREPVLAQLTHDNAGSIKVVSEAEEEERSSHDLSSPSLDDAHNDRVLKKFITIFQGDLIRSLKRRDSSSKALESLTDSIFSVQDEYSKAKPPAGISTEEQRRWIASAVNRKRRSWNELLKELKRIGLASNLKPEVLSLLRNRRRLMEVPVFKQTVDQPLNRFGARIDRYYFLCVGLLSDLEQCFTTHHTDIGTRELQRGITYFQSALSYASSARASIISSMMPMNKILSLAPRLQNLKRSLRRCQGGPVLLNAVITFRGQIAELVDSLIEMENIAQTIDTLSEAGSSVNLLVVDGMRAKIEEGQGIRARFEAITRDAESCGMLILSEDDASFALSARLYTKAVQKFLVDVGLNEPRLIRCCKAINDWHNDWSFGDEDVLADKPSEAYRPHDLRDLLLAITQGLVTMDKSYVETLNDDNDAGHARQQFSSFANITSALRLNAVLSAMHVLSSRLLDQDVPTITSVLEEVLPFLDNYINFVRKHFVSYAAWTKSLFKLAYIHGSLLRNLSDTGFCKATDEAEGGGAGGRPEKSDGTGMGSGTGEENVSEQMQAEEQYEGLRDQKEQSGAEVENDDKALDVDFDFGGDLEDTEPPENDDSVDDRSDQSELDQEFGLNESGNYDEMDEEFWGKEDANKDLEHGESDEGNKEKSQAQTEMLAMETEVSRETEHDEKADIQETLPETEERQTSVEVDMAEEPFGETPGKEGSSENTDDMPEDLEDVDMRSETQRESGQDEGNSESTDEVDGGHESNHDGILEDEQVDNVSAVSDAGIGSHEQDHQDDIDGSTTNADETSLAHDNADIQAGTFTDIEEIKGGQNPGSTDNPNLHVDLTDNHQEKERNQELASDVSTERIEDSLESQIAVGKTGQHNQSGLDETDPMRDSSANITRKLGDALDKVWRRFDEIRNTVRPDAVDGDARDGAAGVEYAPDDQASPMEALGPAQGEDHAELKQLNIIEGDARLDDSLPSTDGRLRDSLGPPALPRERDVNVKEGSESRMDVEANSEPVDAGLVNENGDSGTLDVQVEQQLKEWRERGQPENEGRYLWQLYDSLTQSLSFSLCEQLRLILEPTRATRLMGDFRTGKRLNMKKIIPYIASNFTKDKIWLRRVRPSQREYQILIAVDDSRSMSESHSVHLAFQTLALVSKALNRLEVGDLAISSFGASMQLLHGFEDGPFTDQVGTKVMEAFKFQQSATNVHALLESSIDILTRAREQKSSAADLWQLEIIISDAICQDHEGLRAILRRAEDEHILVVFVVIDALKDQSGSSHMQDSIIELRSATYRSVDGRLQLHEQRYLDTFPFEYFLILKDVESLPDVLSDTLRQFFERISAP